MQRAVTERDFRMPEFRDAKVEDYEFRKGDGKPVRKDRWERGVRTIAAFLFNSHRDFEIDEVVDGVRELLERLPDLAVPVLYEEDEE